MSAATHTPGPWSALPGHSCIGFIDIISRLDGVVAQVTQSDNSPSETDIANAHLIAAAPDLLEACVAMIEWDAREEDHAVDFHARMMLCKAAFQKARAAIAKAEGRS